MNNWNNLSANSRVWIYTCSRPISPNEKLEITRELDQFCESWESHGNKLDCGFEIYRDMVIVLAVDERQEVPGGCSIDGSIALMREIDQRFALNLFDRLQVLAETPNGLVVYSQAEIRGMLSAGELDPETWVVHSTALNLGAWREQRMIPASQTYLGRFAAQN